MIVTVNTKGQVTIPVSIRKKYGLQANDRVDFTTEGDRIILIAVKTLRDFRGTVTGGEDSGRERQAAKDAVGRWNIGEMS